MLDRNLAGIVRVNPLAARRIAATLPRPNVRWVTSDEGVDVPELGPVALASRRRPLTEARRTADGVDIRKKASVLIAGFGAGYHVAELSRRLNGAGLIIVYEPDVALLRAVFERVDHSAWLATTPLVLITDAGDAAGLSSALAGREAELALGLELVDHAPSRERLGDGLARLRTLIASFIDAVQITINTTLVQSITTLRNELSNLDRYASCPGIADLAGAARGRPAIVVSAGPSLYRTLELLARPEVRERFVIIGVQTVLKTLLARGIRPHFVTALDYHEISRRFYEGLTPADVEGITLVAQPMANRAILDAFPGAIRLCRSTRLDSLLGDGLARDMGELKPGATVAHMAYYLARHLGCDPVVLVGQDLGFTDGQYYAAGAAIHETWACELGSFRSLEMLEWERIKRMGGNLRRAVDVHGRPIYTDVQMSAYLEHFQEDFGADAARGLTTVDATGGGVRKQHAEPADLADVLERELHRAVVSPVPPLTAPQAVERSAQVAARIRDVRSDTLSVGELSRRAADILTSMTTKQDDPRTVNRLIDEVNAVRDRVLRLQPAYDLVNFINQAGSLRRLRADRILKLDAGIDPRERQRREIERDSDNVRWLADAADELVRLLDDAAKVLGNAAGVATAGAPASLPASTTTHVQPAAALAGSTPGKTVALIPLLTRPRPGVTPLDAARPFLAGRTALRLTLERLARCSGLDGAVILTDDPGAARAALGSDALTLRVEIDEWSPDPQWQEFTRAARAWSRTCWRGGLGGATVFDELVDPAAAARALGRHGADAAVLVGPDWCLLDSDLTSRLIARRAERPDVHKLVFTQAVPGLCGCVVSRALLADIAAARTAGILGASTGGLLSYQPGAPMPDPIVAGTCVQVPAGVRVPGLRLIPDTALRRAWLGSALERVGPGALDRSSEDLVALLGNDPTDQNAAGPAELTLEICPGRLTSGRRAHWERGSVGAIERPVMSAARAIGLIEQYSTARCDGVVTLGGFGDPLQHPEVLEIAKAASALVAEGRLGATHLRTDLVCDPALVDALGATGVDIVSVDLMAETAPTYTRLMGAPLFERARTNLVRLLTASRESRTGFPRFWVVPRITKCDSTLAEVEDFYDRWTVLAGAACIDPLPISIPGERIAPLPAPARARAAWLASRMTILSDGAAPTYEHEARTGSSAPNALRTSLVTAWRAVMTRRRPVIRTLLSGAPPAPIVSTPATRPLVA